MKKICKNVVALLALGVMIGACTSPLLEDGDVLSASLGLQKSVVRDASAVWIDEPDADLCEGVALSATSVEVNGTDHLIIRDRAGLEAIGDDQDSLEAHYILCNDIRLYSIFTSINSDTGDDAATFEGDAFTGTLEGNYRTIYGLKIHAENSNFVGLFGKIGSDGEIRNLRVSLVGGDAATPSISGYKHVGALAGENEGTIDNVVVTGGYVKGEERNIGGLVGRNEGGIRQSYTTSNVAGAGAVGGLVGWSKGGSITESYATGSVKGEEYIGGLVGSNIGTITESYATGAVEEGERDIGGLVGYNNGGTIGTSYATGSVWGANAKNYRIGGLVGSNSSTGTITLSYATGEVKGADTDSYRIGGLVGSNAGTIKASYARSIVKGRWNIGGLLGYNDGGTVTNSYATDSVEGEEAIGGLVGYNESGTITASYATGAVEGSGINIGGLVGVNGGTITQSYAIGTVKGDSSIGGLIGYSSSTGAITNSYATGNVEGTGEYIGGLVGYNSGTITLGYFDASTTGQSQLIGNESIEDRAYYTNNTDGQVYTEAAAAGDLITQDNFPEWDFTDTWDWQEDGQWPLLQFQEGNSDNAMGSGDDDSVDADSDPPLGLCTGVDQSTTTLEVNGTDYLIIRDRAGLERIRNDVTAHYILCNDIHLDAPFTPINPDAGIDNYSYTFEGDMFTGTLEGNHRTIHGLKIYAENSYSVGLFGTIGRGGKVRNLELSLGGDWANPSISGNRLVGALAGKNEGIIRSVSVSVSVSGSYVKGGSTVGGLVGYNDGGTIIASYATGSVEGERYVGGLVGYNESGTITESYATGAVEGTGEYIGGLVGRNLLEGTITASYATGSVEGGSAVGGLVGYNSGTITLGYFDATATGQSQLVGNESIADRAYYTNNTDGQVYTEAAGTGALITQDNFPDWDFTDTWDWQEDGQWPLLRFQDNSGDDSETSDADSDPPAPLGLCTGVDSSAATVEVNGINYRIIRDRSGLEAMSDNLRAHYILCNDISLEGTFTHINSYAAGDFTGILEGNGRTIRGFKITRSSSYVGLFGKIERGGKVRNLELSLVEGDAANPSISGTEYVGALAGENRGIIRNVAVTGGYVKGSGNYIGGLVGHNYGEIIASYATGSVEGTASYTGGPIGSNYGEYIGGLVGYNYGEIIASYATGSVEGEESIGGLVGHNYDYGKIADSYATGAVEGNYRVGGLVGSNGRWGTITASYATGAVEGTGADSSRIGGLVGSNHGGGTIIASYATGSVEGEESIGGLVGYNYSYGEIADSYATGAVEKGERDIGGLVGHNNGGTIRTSYATGEVKGADTDSYRIGGLVGNNAGAIEASYAKSRVKGRWNIGGLLGYNDGGTVTNSYATDSVEGEEAIGGLVGYNESGTITASYATGAVEGTGINIGGLVGVSGGTITQSYAIGTVKGDSSIGGLIGYSSSTGAITNSYATGNVEGTGEYIGGLVGYNSGTITLGYFDASTTGQSQLIGNESVADRAYYTNNTDGQVYTETAGTGALITQDNFPEWDFTDTWDWQEDGQWPLLQFQANSGDDSEISEGEDTEISEGDSDAPAPLGLCTGVDSSAATVEVNGINYRIIRDRSGLEAIANDQDSLEAHYILCNDISLERTFTQINSYATGDFTGILEGNGRTISGLKITRSSSNYVGLFGTIGRGGKVRNLELSLVEGDAATPSISGKRYVGALAGINEGIIRNVAVTGGYVKGHNIVGGLVGYNYSYGEIADSYATGAVEGDDEVGGLVGWNYDGTITASYATGAVEGDDEVGGLVGSNGYWGTITESYATGAVEGTGADSSGIGGLVGSNSGTITASYATGSVEGTHRLGGGLVGGNGGGTITESYATGSVEGRYYIGGLVGSSGYWGTITASYATGSVAGNDYIGGLVGSNNNNGKIIASYATGSVEGTDESSEYIGGLIGHNSSAIITASYFDATTTGQSQDAVGTNNSANSPDVTPYYTNPADGQVYTETAGTGALITQDNFPEWDFADMWDWQGDGQWPLLQSQANDGDGSGTSEGDSDADSDPPAPLGLCTGVDSSATTLAVDGTDYLIIRDRAGLEAIGDDLAAHYILCNDILLDAPFTQINSYAAGDFTGTLEGNHRTIRNLKIHAENIDYVGLFGVIERGGQVRNLELSLVEGDATNPSITGKRYVGALAGENGGTITNVGVTGGYVKGRDTHVGGLVGYNDTGTVETSYATGSVEGHYHIGGLVGYNDTGTVETSYATGSVEGTGSNIGGLVGGNDGGTITESYATGAVEGRSTVGGLVGGNYGEGQIIASYAIGSVEGTGEYIGGLVGANNGEIKYSYATGSVEGEESIGGLVGYSDGTITASYATGSVEGEESIGGLVGRNYEGTITASYFDASTTGQSQFIDNESVADRAYYTNNTDGQVYTEAAGAGFLIAQDDFPDWDFTDMWDWQEDGQWPLLQFQANSSDDSETSEGDSDADSDTHLDLCADLDASATSLEVDGSDYLIIRDQAGLEAIGDDQDSLEAHHILCNDISLDDTFTQINSYAAGDFTGTLEGNGRTIRGLKITRSNSNFVGLFGVIGESGKVRNLGISLVNGDATTPSISGKRHVGALAGENKGTITNVRVTGGYIQGEERYTGGLVGSNSDSGTIETSYVTGTVEGDRSVGGLVGYNDGGTITESYATGSVEGTGSNIGGLVGYNDNGTVETSYATSSVRGERVIGGLVGWSRRGTITASYAIGSVEGTDESSEYIGGLIGHNSSATITASYFDAITTGQSQAEDEQGSAYYTHDSQVYTEADAAGTLITQGNFSAWDFDAIWHWQGEGQWPILKFETE